MSEQKVIDNRFKLKEQLGSGSFGVVYRAVDMRNKKQVAVKIEDKLMRYPQLHQESRTLKVLKGSQGFPKIHWYGEDESSRYLVMSLHGKNLERYLQDYSKFSLNTSLIIAQQLLTRLEVMHSASLIHRDLKPENILASAKKTRNTVFLVDFGLSKCYRDRRTQRHIPYQSNKQLTGTARYWSINSHLGIEQSRRDDIECWFYVFMHFIFGILPWQGLKTHDMDKIEWYKLIEKRKKDFDVHVTFRDYPVEIQQIYTYIRSLRFNQEPDYYYLNSTIEQIMFEKNMSPKNPFEWMQQRTVNQQRRSTLVVPGGIEKSESKSTEKRSMTFEGFLSIAPNLSSPMSRVSLLSSKTSTNVTLFENNIPVFTVPVWRRLKADFGYSDLSSSGDSSSEKAACNLF